MNKLNIILLKMLTNTSIDPTGPITDFLGTPIKLGSYVIAISNDYGCEFNIYKVCEQAPRRRHKSKQPLPPRPEFTLTLRPACKNKSPGFIRRVPDDLAVISDEQFTFCILKNSGKL